MTDPASSDTFPTDRALWLRLMLRSGRGRWLLLILLGVTVGFLEAAGAALVFVLMGMITAPNAAITLPVLGDLTTLFPGSDRAELLLIVAGTMGVFFLVRGIAYLAQSYLQNRVAENTGVGLSDQLFTGYLNMPYAFHLQRNSASLIRTGYESVSGVVRGVFVPLVVIVSEGFLTLGVLTVLLIVNTIATVGAVVVLLPLVLILLRIVRPRLSSLGAENQEMSQRLIQSFQEGFRGIRDVKILGAQEFLHLRFVRDRAAFARTNYLRALLLEIPRVVLETILVLSVLFVMWTVLRAGGSAEGILVLLGTFAYALFRVLPSVNRIVANFNGLNFSMAAVEHVWNDLQMIDEHSSRSSIAALSQIDLTFNEEIRVQSVSFAYPGTSKPVLRQLDVAIGKGEVVGIVGSTGSGKSTFVDVLMGLLDPDEGAILVDGVDIGPNLPAWQRKLGVVSQSVFLLDDTLRSNIAMGVDRDQINEARIAEAIRLADLTDVVAALSEGLDTMVGEAGVRFSGGQRQRVAIARALYRDPDVLILDEGTSALDGRTEAKVIENLTALQGKTIVMIAHRLTTVSLADKIIVMEGGEIVGVGGYNDLVAQNASFKRLAGELRRSD